MYYPLLRGKQNELLALRAFFNSYQTNSVTPIIEPINEKTNGIIAAIKDMEKRNQQIVIIANPSVGELQNSEQIIIDDLIRPYPNTVIPAFVLTNNLTQAALSRLLSPFAGASAYAIHHSSLANYKDLLSVFNLHNINTGHAFFLARTSSSYRDIFKQSWRILIEDGFERQQRNADYPDSSYFSDLVFTYSGMGFQGFADYQTIGEAIQRGGPAYAVALHLSHVSSQEIHVRHFVSDDNDSPTNPGGKFLQSLNKLMNFIDSSLCSYSNTIGCQEYRKFFLNSHFPGLGYAKRISILHHLDLMRFLLET